METRSLTPDDVALFRQARETLDCCHDPVLHQVAAALRTRDGHTFTGLHMGSRRLNVCAESSAIANAEMARAGDIVTIVAVCKDETGRTVVTNPCGLCRELMGQYGPQADVIVDLHGEVTRVPARSLLPLPWNFPHENAWTVDEPVPTSEETT